MSLSKEQKEQIGKEILAVFNNDSSMVKHCLNNSKCVKIDGGFIDVCDSKPKIDSTIYYNDEYDSPGESKETFINYNIRLHMPETFDKENTRYEYYAIRQYTGQKNNILVAVHVQDKFDEIIHKHIIRKLSETEMQQINEAIKEVQEHYKKRLNTYYKRYSDKIYASGYWANR
jgi:hypothetical protein